MNFLKTKANDGAGVDLLDGHAMYQAIVQKFTGQTEDNRRDRFVSFVNSKVDTNKDLQTYITTLTLLQRQINSSGTPKERQMLTAAYNTLVQALDDLHVRIEDDMEDELSEIESPGTDDNADTLKDKYRVLKKKLEDSHNEWTDTIASYAADLIQIDALHKKIKNCIDQVQFVTNTTFRATAENAISVACATNAKWDFILTQKMGEITDTAKPRDWDTDLSNLLRVWDRKAKHYKKTAKFQRTPNAFTAHGVSVWNWDCNKDDGRRLPCPRHAQGWRV